MLMAGDENSTVQNLYEAHPLCEQSILSRVLEHRGTLRNLSELDLARDSTAITDQNHVGGVDFTLALADAARINHTTRVLDLACGLGGSARTLAYIYGCPVHGIDISRKRIEEAIDLTRRVGLAGRATFQTGDLLAMNLPGRLFDVLWGQCSWSHFHDKNRFLCRWSAVLAPCGTIALEDIFLKRPASSPAESRRFAALEKASLGFIVNEKHWAHTLWRQGFEISLFEDLTAELLRDRHAASARAQDTSNDGLSDLEEEKSRMLLDLAGAGMIGYFRLVADKQS